MTLYIYEPNDPRDPSTHTEAPYKPAAYTDPESGDVTVRIDVQSALEVRVARLESIVWGFEGTLRAIKLRAQKGQAAPGLATYQLEVIRALAELALYGTDPTQTPAERSQDEV